jgi:hypothetical protein
VTVYWHFSPERSRFFQFSEQYGAVRIAEFPPVAIGNRTVLCQFDPDGRLRIDSGFGLSDAEKSGSE